MNYLEVLSDCYPTSEAYVVGQDDPSIYANLVWITTPIPQATLDTAIVPVQISDVIGGQNIFQTSFVYQGDIENKWIGADSAISSDESPYIIPWGCTIVGVGYSNAKDNTSSDIQIYKALYDSGTTKTLLYQWDVRNVRTSSKTDVPAGLTFVAGDKMGIFFSKNGSIKPKDVQLTIYFQIDVDSTISETTEMYNNKFKV